MKARIKTILLSALGAIATFSAITYSSCNSDKCKAIACAYGGVCKEGNCVCPSGYEGAQCETITRDKYAGVWTVFEKGTITQDNTYDVTFKYGISMTDMQVINFYNKLVSPVSIRLVNDTLYIPQQTVDGFEISGSGVLDRDPYYSKHGKLTIRYTIRDLQSGQVNDFGVNPNTYPSIWQR